MPFIFGQKLYITVRACNRIIVDTDKKKVADLRKGEVQIYEPGLEELVRRNMAKRRLEFTTNLEKAVQESLLVFVAVGTPPQPDGSVDMSAVSGVATSIGKAVNGYKIIITKSTVPVGTTRKLQATMSTLSRHKIALVSNPEFLKEGKAVEDFMKPDRVVLGVDDPSAAEIMQELYAPFVRTENPILVMDFESAEMTKYASNAFLATRISFINEIAALCEHVGADVESVRKGMGADNRIGYAFLFPGVGYGGSCFPKDVKALIKVAEDCGCNLRIAKAVEDVNVLQRDLFVSKIRHHFVDLAGKTIAVWGLAFKPETDDVRDAPAITVIESLLTHGAAVRVHDPKALAAGRAAFGERVEFSTDPYAALENADAMALITEWSEFRNPDFERMKLLMKTPVVFDGRNIYNPAKLRQLGFTYYGIGRA